MQDRSLVRQTKMAAVLMAVFLSLFVLIYNEITAGAQKIDIVGRGTELAERVAPDDGAVFVVHFTGDMHGNLGSCG